MGEAWAWSEGLLGEGTPGDFPGGLVRMQVRMRETFDSSRTPKVGEVLAGPAEVGRFDVEAIREKLTGAVASASERDPKKLLERIHGRG